MAKIVNVTDVDGMPGVGELHFDDGRPPLLALPEIADEHRERLGIRTAMTAGVAGPGTGTRDLAQEDRDDFVNTMKGVGRFLTTPAVDTRYAPKGGAQVQAPPAAGGAIDPVSGLPLPPKTRVGTAAEFPPPAPTPAPAAPAPATGGAPPPAIAAPPEPVDPGQAGLGDLEAQLLEEARTGERVVPGKPGETTNRSVFESGTPYSPEAAKQRLEASRLVLDTQMSKMAADKQVADATASRAATQNMLAQQQAAQLQADLQRKQQQFQQQDAALQKDLADYTESAAPNPNKYWDTLGGGVSQILSIIGQSLGAFAATRQGTENFGMKAAQQRIQQELAAQEKAMDAGRADRQNALARLTAYYNGDREMGKLALSQALNKVAETETNRIAAQSRSQDITGQAKMLAAQFAQQQLLDEQKRQELAVGKTTTTHETGYTPAHTEKLTPDQRLAIYKGLQEKTAEGLKPKEAADSLEHYGKRRSEYLDAKLAAEHLASAYGLKVNRETGELTMPDGKPVDPDAIDIAGSGPWDRVRGEGFFASAEGREVARLQLENATKYRLATSGVAFRPEEMEDARRHESGTFDSDSVRILAQRVADLYRKETELDSSYPASVVKRYREQNEAIHRERAQRGAAAPKGKPYKPGGS